MIFVHANTLVNLIEVNKNKIVENKRLKIKINVPENKETNIRNLNNKHDKNEFPNKENLNNIKDKAIEIGDPNSS